MACAAATAPPPLRIVSRSSSTEKKQKIEKKRAALEDVFQVARRDRAFVSERLRWAAEPLRPIPKHVSEVFSDIFWLRFLENNQAQYIPRQRSSWPCVSYPPGLSGSDILMADIEALKTYSDYIQHFLSVWNMPLPEFYDPEKVEVYFNCRPHVLFFRLLEVFFSFSYAAIRLQLTRIFKFSTKDLGGKSSLGDTVGQFLKETMLNLGPAFIKVGQSLSTRPDITGSEISKALSELHDRIPPFPSAVAMKIIEMELGGPVQNYFSYISEETVAAASFGQVYKGRTHDGCTVAIKVQRPNLLHSVVRDIYILRLGLNVLKKAAKRKNDLYLYADELGKGLVGELDYRIESANASEFLEVHSQYSFMSVPKVLVHLTSKRVLTMEWMVGESPYNLLLRSGAYGVELDEFTKVQQMEAKRSLLDLVSKGVEATLVQLLETGLLHADPHPGNLRYTTEGCIGFLDFGLLCRMKQEHQIAMLASIVHIVYGDWEALLGDLASMDVVRPGTNIRRVTADFVETLGEIDYRDGIPDIKFSLVLGKILSIALKHHFRMPPYYTLVLRSLASLEGLAVAADENFKTFQAAYPYVVKKLLYENSASSRRILYSVIFNKRREIQWMKILLFLKVGSLRVESMEINRNGSNELETQKSEHDVSQPVNLILRLLPSKDGVVLRRLMVTADAVSLCRVMISKDAILFRQHISLILADVIYAWMNKTICGDDEPWSQYKGQKIKTEAAAKITGVSNFYAIMRDRRLKVIFYRMMRQVRSHPVLMLRSCWSCFTIAFMALLISLSRFIASCSQSFFNSLAFVPRRIALSL
ncbi:uncharacterized protein LOC110031371 isoform X2 [Phalaenopsis equestris]|uniref:uncharacterized protein LOC110031371 isoform X2 n=1 Tax=Phalaenopsis equestris TaxID=78828 RepID=UPI0009E34240|nr:uncharacterized protein LOC110031371 isoform X2 [Phalaenopsis equestris]